MLNPLKDGIESVILKINKFQQKWNNNLNDSALHLHIIENVIFWNFFRMTSHILMVEVEPANHLTAIMGSRKNVGKFIAWNKVTLRICYEIMETVGYWCRKGKRFAGVWVFWIIMKANCRSRICYVEVQ